MASQWKARVQRTTITISSADKQTGLRGSGTVITFPGFLKLYEEGKDDTPDEKDGPTLPAVNAGDALNVEKIAPGNTLPSRRRATAKPRL